MSESVYIGPDGWVSVPGPEGTGVHVRLQQRGDHLAVTDLYVHGAEVTGELLRLIQPARIEARVTYASHVAGDMPEGVTSHHVPEILRQISALPEGRDKGTTVAELRRRQGLVAQLPAKPRKPLTRPEGQAGDAFYRQVAEAYRSAAAETNRATSVLAAESGIPVDTVRRWVREARRRGMLPPGRPGRAG